MKVRIPVTYTTIYGEEPEPFCIEPIRNQLIDFDRNLLIDLAINLLTLGRKDLSVIDFCHQYFGYDDQDFVKDFIMRFELSKEKHDSAHPISLDYCILGIRGALELLSIVFSLPDTGKMINTKEIKERMFISILKINEIHTDFQIPEFSDNTIFEFDDNTIKAHRALSISLSYDDLINDDKNWIWLLQIYKAFEFFNFCDNDIRFEKILSEYLRMNGFENWNEFLKTMIVLTSTFKSESDIIYIDANKNSNCRTRQFFTPLAITKDLVVPYEVDFKIFRDKPLFEVSRNKYLVIDRYFLYHKLYSSLFFGLMRINKELGVIKDLAQEISYRFTEQKLFHKTISTMFSKNNYIKYSSYEMDNNGNSGTPDFYIRNGNNIFIFECKDVKFTKEVKTSKNWQCVENFLREKLVEKDSGRPSAAYQIANFISTLYQKKFQLDYNYDPKKIKIYPIIVTGDSAFTCYGISVIINKYFRQKLAYDGINNNRIKDIALLSLDNAIAYQDNFRLKKNNIKDVLESYYRFLKVDTPFKIREKGDIVLNMIHSMFSLSNYMKIPVEKTMSYLKPLFEFLSKERSI